MKSPARWCRATERKGQRYVHIRLGNNKMSVNQANPRHVLEFTRGQELRGCGDLWQGSKGGTSFHQGVSGSPGGEAMCGVHRRYAKHAKRIWFRCISLVCREANQPTIRPTPPVDPIQTDPSWPWMAWLAWQFAILNTLKRSAEGWEIGGSSGHRRGVKRGYQALRGAAAVRVGVEGWRWESRARRPNRSFAASLDAKGGDLVAWDGGQRGWNVAFSALQKFYRVSTSFEPWNHPQMGVLLFVFGLAIPEVTVCSRQIDPFIRIITWD